MDPIEAPEGARPADRGTTRATPEGAKPLISSARVLLWVAGALVFLAGVQLFVFSERTQTFFAWTIDVPLTAAFLGAGYWSSVAFEWLAARERLWAHARVALPTVLLFTMLTLVATLVHVDLFHFGNDSPVSAQAAAWAWLAIYACVPVAMALVLTLQIRTPGSDPPRLFRLAAPLRVLLLVQAAVMLGIGLLLFVNPEGGASLWPWPLTPLTGRAVGAWVLSIGVAALHVALENDGRRARGAAIAYLLLGGLQLVAVARHPDTIVWEQPHGPGYIVFLASMLVAGAGVLRTGLERSPGRR